MARYGWTTSARPMSMWNRRARASGRARESVARRGVLATGARHVGVVDVREARPPEVVVAFS